MNRSEIIKQKIIIVLSQPSTWRGIINSCGGIAGTLALLHMINPLFAISLPVCMLLAGVVGTFTDDYASTATKVDDMLHAAASAIKDSSGGSTTPDENATEE